MGCCGNKRAAASATLRRQDPGATPHRTSPRAAPPTPARDRRASSATPARAADIRMRYLGAQPVRVRGAASGRTYHASPADPSLTIDARDAAALTRTGLFRAR
jgi:hypothetical protein